MPPQLSHATPADLLYGQSNGNDVLIAVGLVSGAAGAVSSVFTRTGAVAAQSGDYSVAQVTGAAPLASPTFTGTVTIPGGTIDGTTIGGTTPVQAQAHRPTDSQTGTTYTLVLGDADKLVTLSNASGITLTVPPNSSVAFATNSEVDLVQLGAGQVTVAAGAGVTVNSYSGKLKLAGQYAGGTLKKLGTDSWILIGNLA